MATWTQSNSTSTDLTKSSTSNSNNNSTINVAMAATAELNTSEDEGYASSNNISATDAANLVKSFIKGDGTINCLNNYYQTAYHFRLFMTQEINPYKDATTPAQVYKNVLNAAQITIAESGVTSYNIKSVSIDSVVGPNVVTRSVNTTKMTIVITEPMGRGFVESLRLAADELKIKNYNKTFYFLELSFKAYNEDGTFCENPVSSLSLDGVDRWIFRIAITDIQVHLDAAGGTYTLTCLQWDDTGFDDDIKTVPDNISCSGGTLQAMFDSLASALNDSWVNRHNNETVKYSFKFHPLTRIGNNLPYGVSTDLSSWTTSASLNKEYIRNFSMVNGLPMAQFQSGMTIDKMVEAAVFATSEGKTLVDAAAVNGVKEGLAIRVEAEVEVDNGLFEYYSQQYYRLVTFHIYPFYSQQGLYKITQPNDALQNDQSSGYAMQRLLENHYLRKRYDYLYTGKNTEVTNFDIKYDLKWCALLPRLNGESQKITLIEITPKIDASDRSANSTSPAQQFDSQQDNQTWLQNNATNQAQNQQVDSDIQQKTNLETQIASATGSQKTELQSQLTTLNSQLQSKYGTSDLTSIKQQETQRNLKNAQSLRIADQKRAAALGTTEVKANTSIYAETFVEKSAQDSSSNIIPKTHVAFTQTYKEDILGTGTNTNAAEQTVFGAVIDQMCDSDVKQLVNITLEIRGDPYWLGQTNLCHFCYIQNNVETFSSLDAPDWTRGDTTFLLRFRYPLIQNNNFVPIFNDDETFNGIYRAYQITHTFSDGQFKQTIVANKLPLIDLIKAAGYTGISSTASSSTTLHSDGTITKTINGKTVIVGHTNGRTLLSPDLGDGQAHAVSTLSPSSTVVSLIKAQESCKLTSYQDSGGVWTIGWGHTDGVTAGQTISQEEADNLLNQDVSKSAAKVDKAIGSDTQLTQNQYDALVDLSYNLSDRSFNNSDVVKDIKAGNTDSDTISSDLSTLTHDSAGNQLSGLVFRRNAESLMYSGQNFYSSK